MSHLRKTRQARAGRLHVAKEGPFREDTLAAMEGGLREHDKLGGLYQKGG